MVKFVMRAHIGMIGLPRLDESAESSTAVETPVMRASVNGRRGLKLLIVAATQFIDCRSCLRLRLAVIIWKPPQASHRAGIARRGIIAARASILLEAVSVKWQRRPTLVASGR